MRMKYIIVKDGNLEVPHLFSECSSHFHVANAITKQNIDRVVSAGFCDYVPLVHSEYGDYTWSCFGKSTTLHIESRTIDAQIMNQMFYVNN